MTHTVFFSDTLKIHEAVNNSPPRAVVIGK